MKIETQKIPKIADFCVRNLNVRASRRELRKNIKTVCEDRQVVVLSDCQTFPCQDVFRTQYLESHLVLNPVKGKRTFEEVSSRIKALIFGGFLLPGDRLPSEAVLAKQFTVGRQTVREALRILELSGFITVQTGAGGGAVIKNTLLSSISGLLSDAFQLEEITTTDLTAARLAIEKAVLIDAVARADSSDIARLKENVAEARRRLGDNVSAIATNMEFHTLLAEVSKNGMFLVVQKAINAVTCELISRLKPDAETFEEAITCHEAIIDAIADSDFSRAIALLERHLLEVGNSLLALGDLKKQASREA
jgi:GntR family transcriptional repressor for pyruvate dehydrogenase complex